jgi:hypothetical protein
MVGSFIEYLKMHRTTNPKFKIQCSVHRLTGSRSGQTVAAMTSLRCSTCLTETRGEQVALRENTCPGYIKRILREATHLRNTKTAFWRRHVVWQKGNNVSWKPAASIFRVEQWTDKTMYYFLLEEFRTFPLNYMTSQPRRM